MFDISNTTRQNPLSKEAVFAMIKKEILGEKYELSLVFAGDKKTRKLNSDFRSKEYTPNVLSFPINKSSGEIFINLKKAKSEAKDFEMSEKNYIKFLFIHGCIHLKGIDHGKKMTDLENKFSEKFLK